MAKTSVEFQNDWPKTVGGVVLTSQLLTNRWVTARLYRTCMLQKILTLCMQEKISAEDIVLTQVRQKILTLCMQVKISAEDI